MKSVSIFLSVCLSDSLNLSDYSSVLLSICPIFRLTVYPSVRIPTIHLFHRLSVYLSVRLSVKLKDAYLVSL